MDESLGYDVAPCPADRTSTYGAMSYLTSPGFGCPHLARPQTEPDEMRATVPRYIELFKANGYSEIAEVEDAMKRSYARIKTKRSLAFRLAYAADFESMTLGVTKWLIEDRVKLFAGADTRVVSFVL